MSSRVDEIGAKLADLFPYSSSKSVIIKDARIGALNFLFNVCIFLYIIVWQMLHNKQFLKCEDPSASVLVGLRWPEQLDEATCETLGSTLSYGHEQGDR